MNTQTTNSIVDFALETQIRMFHNQPDTLINLIESGEEINAVLDASCKCANNVLIENNELYANSYWKTLAALASDKVSA